MVCITGDTINDQALLEVLTDKASSELPSPVAGKVISTNGEEGERIKVGEILIEIEEEQIKDSSDISAENKAKALENSKPSDTKASNHETNSFIPGSQSQSFSGNQKTGP